MIAILRRLCDRLRQRNERIWREREWRRWLG
jgi:hypothetical protein